MYFILILWWFRCIVNYDNQHPSGRHSILKLDTRIQILVMHFKQNIELYFHIFMHFPHWSNFLGPVVQRLVNDKTWSKIKSGCFSLFVSTLLFINLKISSMRTSLYGGKISEKNFRFNILPLDFGNCFLCFSGLSRLALPTTGNKNTLLHKITNIFSSFAFF